MVHRQDEGLIAKFKVERLTPSSRGIDHDQCRYFVLDPLHDENAFYALAYYGEYAALDGNMELNKDIGDWLKAVLVDPNIGWEPYPELLQQFGPAYDKKAQAALDLYKNSTETTGD